MEKSVKDQFTVESVDTYLCREWCLKKHYAKRLPPISYSFGLYNLDKILLGICTFGTPVSSTLRNLWQNKYELIELNRLVVNDGLPKNTLSFFVSKALGFLPKPLVIASYADTSKNHHGYIYQATNWKYTGLSVPFKDYYIKGMEHLHNGTVMDLSRGQENRIQWLRDKFGDDLIMIDRPQKHRYFQFLGNKFQVKDMVKMCPYDFLPYPKGQNIRYDSSYETSIQTKLF
jgi:hypothetical protein